MQEQQKHAVLLFAFVAVFSALIAVGVAISVSMKRADAPAVPAGENPRPPSVATSTWNPAILDIDRARTGDMLAGWKLVSLAPHPGLEGGLSLRNVQAKFSGQTTLKGTYSYEMNEFAGIRQVCFRADDPAEREKLPVLAVQVNAEATVFCFANEAEAERAFGPSYGVGPATVTIKDFELNYAVESISLAELVERLP